MGLDKQKQRCPLWGQCQLSTATAEQGWGPVVKTYRGAADAPQRTSLRNKSGI